MGVARSFAVMGALALRILDMAGSASRRSRAAYRPAVPHVAGFIAKAPVSGMKAQTDDSPTAPTAASIRNATVLPERACWSR